MVDEPSVLEYIDSIRNVLNELAKEEISYSDYDNMTDWLSEIEKQVKKLEKKQEPMEVRFIAGRDCDCPVCDLPIGYLDDYCCNCGQKFYWESGDEKKD